MARELAKRSLCSRDQVGCVITDVNNKIIGEGYNGPPKGFWHGQAPCTQWCQRATRAKWRAGEEPYEDPGSSVPNWAAPGHRDLAPDYSDCPSLHAEANALMMSDRTLRTMGTIYVTSHVCMGCAKLIANSGLQRVIVMTDDDAPHRNAYASYEFMLTCGLEIHVNGKKVVAS